MPLYTYENTETGQRIVLMQQIADRDTVPGHRRIFEAPKPLKSSAAAFRLPCQQAEQVLAGYRELEQRGELRHTKQQADEIKEAWRMPPVADPVETATA